MGGLWEYYLQKGTRRESKAEQSKEKAAQDTKDGGSPPPDPRAKAESDAVCRGGNRWLSRNGAQGSLLSSNSF